MQEYTTCFYTRNGRLAQTAKNLQHLSIQLTLLTERKKKTSDHLNKGRKPFYKMKNPFMILKSKYKWQAFGHPAQVPLGTVRWQHHSASAKFQVCSTFHLPSNMPLARSSDGSSSWVPGTYAGNLNGIHDSWPQLWLAMGVATNWRENELTDCSLSLFISVAVFHIKFLKNLS